MVYLDVLESFFLKYRESLPITTIITLYHQKKMSHEKFTSKVKHYELQHFNYSIINMLPKGA